MEIQDLISSYSDAATLVGFYWNFYAVVAFALVGYFLGIEGPISTYLRRALLAGFIMFAFASFGALMNKHGLHYALAFEIQNHPDRAELGKELSEKLTVCNGVWNSIVPTDCLHATPPIWPAILHVLLDALVALMILMTRKDRSSGGV